MFGSLSKLTVRINDTSSQSSPFSCSSFKDIQDLCADEAPHQSTESTASKKPASIFHRVRVVNSLLRAWSTRPSLPQPEPDSDAVSSDTPTKSSSTAQSEPPSVSSVSSDAPSKSSTTQPEPPSISIPGAENRITFYFTSLRVVRPTFEACKAVQSILQGFRVTVDERDLSMDSRFLPELQKILGQKSLTLPRVFIGGRYVGGSEEIKQLHEAGELKKFVQGLPAAEPGVCNTCGSYRFIMCNTCNGSHKVYTEKSGFKACMACNDNGLILCPSCFCTPLDLSH